MRILIFTGKGGVGKTSMAAATACHLADNGQRVLIMSTDTAHSLGDAFETKLTSNPKELALGLFAMELDTDVESKRVWGRLNAYLEQLISMSGDVGIDAKEVLILPGLEELLTMLRILDFYTENQYDTLIVDCAPTGKTLAMLRFPEILDRLMEKMLTFVRVVTMMAGPIISKRTGVPKPEDKVFKEFEVMVGRLMQLEKLLSDTAVTSIRIVTTLERTVLDEARRNFMWMHLYGFNVDALIVNRVYPEAALRGYFGGWETMQKEGLRLLEESFQNQKIWKMELQNAELKGKTALTAAAAMLYGSDNPIDVYATEKSFKLEKENGEDVLVMPLPFASQEELRYEHEGEELCVWVRNEVRRFKLPDSLLGKEVVSDGYEKESYRIHFR